MAEVIKMPRMSDTMTEGVIVSWLKKVGDTVKSGDVLAEVETDKATMELENYTDGTLLYIGIAEGQAVAVDGVLAVIGAPGEDYQALLSGAGAAPAAPTNAAPAVATETAPPAEQPAAQPDTQPAAQPQAQPAEQPQAQPAAQPAAQQPAAQTSAQPAATPETAPAPTEEERVKASPLAKKIADEKGIPLQQVNGSGDQGRIVKRDVENYTSPAATQAAAAPAPAPASTTSVVPGKEGFHDVVVSQMRKTIARRLVESKTSAPHFYLTMDINMGRVMDARVRINEYLGTKVSFNDIIIRAAAAALRAHPKVNGSWLGDKLRYYDHIHIGVAIAVEDGLVVPVIRFADAKSISQISAEVKAYAEKAKTKKMQPADYEGNTFTISNLGMFGIEDFTAIINPPDACIMAVGAIQQKPIVENGEIKIGNMMKVTLSCDHRIVDGATGAQFLQTFKQYLEEPVIILA